MSNVEALRKHEGALLEFGRFMVNPPSDPLAVDYAEMGRLAAEVINGIPAVRAALKMGSLVADIELELGDHNLLSTGQCDCGLQDEDETFNNHLATAIDYRLTATDGDG